MVGTQFAELTLLMKQYTDRRLPRMIIKFRKQYAQAFFFALGDSVKINLNYFGWKIYDQSDLIHFQNIKKSVATLLEVKPLTDYILQHKTFLML